MLYVCCVSCTHIVYIMCPPWAGMNVEYSFCFAWMLFEGKFVEVKIYMIWRHARATRTSYTHVIDDTAQLFQTRAHNIYNAHCIDTSTSPIVSVFVVMSSIARNEYQISMIANSTHEYMMYNTITDIIILSEIILRPVRSAYWWNQIRFFDNNKQQKTWLKPPIVRTDRTYII